MTAEPAVFIIDSTPKQVTKRLLFWWLIALLLLARLLWRLTRLRDGGAMLTLDMAVEFAAIGAFWIYAVATYKLIISTARAWCVELHDDHLRYRFLNGKDWRAFYRDITETSLHFSDWRCDYDGMELGVDAGGGKPGLTGGSRCRGEIMEELTAELRRRVESATGRSVGSAAGDRLSRIELSRCEHRKQRIALTLLLPLAFIPSILVEFVSYQERSLAHIGVGATGTITVLKATNDSLHVEYVYGDERGMDLRGRGDFALRTYHHPRLGDVRAIEPGDNIAVLYNPRASFHSTPAFAAPRTFGIARALCLLPLIPVLFLIVRTRKGHYLSITRGRVLLLTPGELPEDRL